MHKRSLGKCIGAIIAGIGLVILLAIILPTNILWFIFGALLICLGIAIMKS